MKRKILSLALATLMAISPANFVLADLSEAIATDVINVMEEYEAAESSTNSNTSSDEELSEIASESSVADEITAEVGDTEDEVSIDVTNEEIIEDELSTEISGDDSTETEVNDEVMDNTVADATPIVDGSVNIETDNIGGFNVTLQSESTETSEVVLFSETTGFSYSIIDETYCSITGYTGTETNVVIPDEIDGYPVQEIGENAFSEYKSLTSITIPEGVTSILDHAFMGCSEVKKIYWNAKSVANFGQFSNVFSGVGTNSTGFEVVFGNNVEKIPSCAFYKCTTLTSIIIGDGVTSIGYYAFYGCTGLISVTIPDNVTNIGSAAFEGCTALNKVYWNASNVTLSSGIFENSGNIETGMVVIFGENTTQIPSGLFKSCTGLTSVIIPDSITNIGDSAFYGCTGLGTITIHSNITSIGRMAFYDCAGLTTVTIEEGITSIKDFAFYGCTSLSRMIVPNSIKSMGEYTFSGCTGLISLTMSDSITTIGRNVFSDCTSLTDVTIPNSVNNIVDYAFSGCTKLTSIDIPDSVKSIGYGAFYGCTELKNITLPDNITEIEANAFTLTKYHEDNTNWDNGVLYINNCLLDVNETLSGDVKIKDNIYLIADRAFAGCTNIIGITISNNVTKIGKEAFLDCVNIEKIYWDTDIVDSFYSKNVFSNLGTSGPGVEVVFGKNTKNIPSYLFYCSSSSSFVSPNIRVITISENVTYIGSNAFSNCTNVNKIYWNAKCVADFSPTNTSFSRDAFSSIGTTSEGVDVIFGDKVEQVPSFLFYSNSNLHVSPNIKNILLSNSITNIGSYAFSGCDGLTSITIPDNITNIGSYAFSGCDGLTSITIPDNITNIGSYAFNECRNIEKIYWNAKCVADFSYSSNIFARAGINGSGIEVVFGDTVEKIPNYLFRTSYSYQQSNLKKVIMSDSVTNIGDYTFYGCTNLVSVTIGVNVKTIGDYAFSGCTGLEKIYWNAKNASLWFVYHPFSSIGTATSGVDVIFGELVENIPSYLFCDAEASSTFVSPNIKNVTIGENVKSIGKSAFECCTTLTNIIIPDNVKIIGDEAFKSCSRLTSVALGNKITSIGKGAFAECDALTNIRIPDSVTNIGPYAFENCIGLTSVFIGSNVTSIKGRTFSGCSNLLSVDGTKNIRAVGNDAFKHTKITYLSLPKCENISSDAFANCINLSNIELSKNIGIISSNSFYECNSLDNIKITNDTQYVGSISKIYFDGTCDPTGVSIYGQTVGAPGDVFALEKDVYPYDAYNYITTWSSSNTSVATVDCGIVTCIANGITTITAKTTNGLTDTITIVVTDSKLQIDGEEFSVIPDDTITVYATLESDDYTGADAVWTTTNASVAIVESSGYTDNGDGTYKLWADVKGIEAGETNVVVSIGDISEQCKLVINKKHKTYAGNFGYRLDDDGDAIITEITTSDNSETVSVPTEIDGHKVIAIDEYCIYNNSDINRIIIPPTIELIKEDAFKNTDASDDLKIYYLDTKDGWKEITEEKTVVSDGTEIVYVMTDTDNTELSDYNTPKAKGDKPYRVIDAINTWEKEANEWLDVLIKVMNNIKEDVTIDDAETDEAIDRNFESNKSSYKKMMAIGHWSEAEQNAAYRGLFDFMSEYGDVEKHINFDKVDDGDIISLSNSVVKKVVNSMSNDNFSKTYGDYTVYINIFHIGIGDNYAFTGNVTVVNNRTGKSSEMGLINSTPEDTKKVISEYMLQLKELGEKTVETAMKEYINDLSSLTGINMPLDEIKEKLDGASKVINDTLEEKGLDNLNNFIGSFIDVIKSTKEVIELQDSGDTDALIIAIAGLDEKLGFLSDDSMTATQYALDWAYKALKQRTNYLKEVVEAYIDGKEIPKYETAFDKVVNWFDKYIFQCPVDVYVYNENNELIGCVSDEQIFGDTDEIYVEKNGDTKTVYVAESANVRFELVGTDVGILNVVSEKYQDNKVVGRINFYGIDLYDGKEISAEPTQNVSVNGCAEINLESSGEKISTSEYLKASDNATVFVEADIEGEGTVTGDGWYARGDSVTLLARPKQGYLFRGWYNGNIPVSFNVNYTFCAKDFVELTAKFDEYYVEPAIMYGDVLNDGVINMKDAQRLYMYVVGSKRDLTEYELMAADVYRDGKINVKDAQKLAQYLAGWPDVKLGE